MDGACGTYTDCVSMGKYEGKRQVGRPGRRQEDNVK